MFLCFSNRSQLRFRFIFVSRHVHPLFSFISFITIIGKKQILHKTRTRNARPYGYGATYCLDGK